MYIVGFLAFALLGSGVAVSFAQFLQSRVEREYQYAGRVCIVTAFVGFLALCVQAVVPMQRDVYDLINADQPLSQDTLSMQSLAHQAASSLFLMASWLFMTVVLYIYK